MAAHPSRLLALLVATIAALAGTGCGGTSHTAQKSPYVGHAACAAAVYKDPIPEAYLHCAPPASTRVYEYANGDSGGRLSDAP